MLYQLVMDLIWITASQIQPKLWIELALEVEKEEAMAQQSKKEWKMDLVVVK